jgi:hypothetical protein
MHSSHNNIIFVFSSVRIVHFFELRLGIFHFSVAVRLQLAACKKESETARRNLHIGIRRK